MNFFWSLQAREKIFVVCAALAIVGFLVFQLGFAPLLDRSVTLDRQLRSADNQLAEIRTLQQDYLQQKSVVDRINAQLQQQQKNFAIFSHLERLAGETSIRDKILYMKPTVSAPNEIYDEESVEIKMEGVTLEQLIRYLHQVENSPQLLKIKRLYIKPRLDDRQILTVIFRVSTFNLKTSTS